MKKHPVKSSNLASVGYDAKNEILEIEFKHGGVYQYFEVPIDEHEALMNATSHGSYFHQNIKDVYDYQKL